MALQAGYFKRTFHFSFKARTSRGLMNDKVSWFIKLWDDSAPDVYGIGECGPLPGLSPDANADFETVVQNVVQKISTHHKFDSTSEFYSVIENIIPAMFPAIYFGLETAWYDLINGGKRIIFKNAFTMGQPLPINGLIWMGDLDFMMNQVNQKIIQGFRCIKLKVGGLDFERECDILQYLRKRYFRENIVIRLDANGAFKTEDVFYKLAELSKYNIHSIEQPLKSGVPEMEEVCRKSPIPIALDEELIGKYAHNEKTDLLTRLLPQYIILKPTLHGGLKGCKEWIEIAERLKIGWWITSALESNIGLNAICQFTANYPITQPQGLGTGMIYENNFDSPLRVMDGTIFYDQTASWGSSLL